MQNAVQDVISSEWADLVARLVVEAGILNEDVEAHVRNAFSRVIGGPLSTRSGSLVPASMLISPLVTSGGWLGHLCWFEWLG